MRAIIYRRFTRDLEFSRPEIFAVVASVYILFQISGDGETNWIEGVQDLSVYVILGILRGGYVLTSRNRTNMQPETTPLLILGTGTFAVEIAELASEIPGVTVAGFVENMNQSRCGESLDGRPVHWIEDLGPMVRTHRVVCGLGTTHRSRFTQQAEALGCEFATLVHPTARVPASSSLGKGTIVNVGVIIASHTHLGTHVSVNRGATIGHHTRIENFVTIGPGVNLAGNCRVGAASYIGIGATIIDNLTIGSRSVVAAGAVVTENVPDRVLVVGVPAKVVKRNIEGK
jgi:sugar O-acyltransferase (sialic acid O-acetyltransferase NeuD family)